MEAPSKHQRHRSLALMATALGLLAWLQVLDVRAELGPFRVKRFDLLSGLRTNLPPQEGPASWMDPGLGASEASLGPISPPTDPLAFLPGDPETPNPEAAERAALAAAIPSDGILEFLKPNGWGGLRDLSLRLRNALDHRGLLARSFRVIHYGDSMLEGDLISQHLRRSLQDRFGGSGVGLLGMTSITANFRSSINHHFSDDWTDVQLTKPREGLPLGPMGHTWMPRALEGLPLEAPRAPATAAETAALLELAVGSSWASYEVAPGGTSPEPFKRLRLFYEGANPWAYLVAELDGVPYPRRLATGKGLQVARFNLGDAGARKVRLRFICPGELLVYGLSIDEPVGAFVDNISYRGSQGSNFAQVDPRVLSEMGQELGWNLAVLEFGLNVADPQLRDFSHYRREMSAFTSLLTDSVPDLAILVVGTYDMALRAEDGSMASNPSVPLVCWDQARLAKEINGSYWHLYGVLGGAGSMVKLRAEGLSNRDFTHLSVSGAQLVGQRMYEALERALLD